MHGGFLCIITNEVTYSCVDAVAVMLVGLETWPPCTQARRRSHVRCSGAQAQTAIRLPRQAVTATAACPLRPAPHEAATSPAASPPSHCPERRARAAGSHQTRTHAAPLKAPSIRGSLPLLWIGVREGAGPPGTGAAAQGGLPLPAQLNAWPGSVTSWRRTRRMGSRQAPPLASFLDPPTHASSTPTGAPPPRPAEAWNVRGCAAAMARVVGGGAAVVVPGVPQGEVISARAAQPNERPQHAARQEAQLPRPASTSSLQAAPPAHRPHSMVARGPLWPRRAPRCARSSHPVPEAHGLWGAGTRRWRRRRGGGSVTAA